MQVLTKKKSEKDELKKNQIIITRILISNAKKYDFHSFYK